MVGRVLLQLLQKGASVGTISSTAGIVQGQRSTTSSNPSTVIIVVGGRKECILDHNASQIVRKCLGLTVTGLKIGY